MDGYTLARRKAKCLNDLQQIARNQLEYMALLFEEKARLMRLAVDQVNSVVDFSSYEDILTLIDVSGAVIELDALLELGNEYQTIISGDYFNPVRLVDYGNGESGVSVTCPICVGNDVDHSSDEIKDGVCHCAYFCENCDYLIEGSYPVK